MKKEIQMNVIGLKPAKKARDYLFKLPWCSFVKKSFPAVLFIMAAAMLASCSTSQSSRPISEADYPNPIRVACVGDSITFGHAIPDREHNSYPAQLQALLGKHWEVRNFGVNGSTLLRNGTRPYNEQSAFRDALAFKPDVVVIQLGTNDTNTKSWQHKGEFVSDYIELIRSFQDLDTKPRIYICRPVPLFRDRGKKYDTDKILAEEIIPKINEVGQREHLPVINLYAEFEGKSALFPDGVHPNAEGARIMSRKIYVTLTGVKAASSL